MRNWRGKAMVLGASLWIGAIGMASAYENCARLYLAADDRPLRQPSRELAETQRQAKAGDARAQRNLAVSYETGYLVAKCDEKAAYWYEKAAANGDEIARKWLTRHAQFAQMKNGGECFESQCLGSGSEGARSATLTASPRGHYYAPVNINGVTETGLIDTGATIVAMSEETAKKFGIKTQGGVKGKAQTASGTVDTTNVTVPLINVGGIALRDVRVAVGIQGQMLVGMSFLGRLEMKTAGGVLVLSK